MRSSSSNVLTNCRALNRQGMFLEQIPLDFTHSRHV
jgi:hypothetical protein